MKLLTNLDLSRNEIKNVVIHNLPSHPSEQKEGQVYFNTSQNQHYAYRNGKWTVLGSDSIADIIGLQDALDSKGSIENEHNHKNKAILDGIDEDRVAKWDNSVEDAKGYTDAQILEINGGAPSSSNSLKKISDTLDAHKESIDTLDALVKTKADDKEIKSILATKANLVEVNNKLSAKADAETVNSELEKKALKSVVEQMNVDLSNAINTKMDIHAHPYKSENWYPTWNDVTDKPTIPTKVSQLTNDSGFITSIPSEYVTETELTSKGYLTEHQDISGKADKTELHSHSNKTVLDGITSAKITSWNNKSTFSGDYNDLSNKPTIPTKTSELTNDSKFITTIPSEYVTETELNAKGYLTEHQDISNKVDKVSGKGLSTNDYTTSEKNKLAGIEAGANNVKVYTAKECTTFTSDDGTCTPLAVQKAVGMFPPKAHEHSQYLTEHQDISGLATKEYVDNAITNLNIDIDYDSLLAFDTNEIITNSNYVDSNNNIILDDDLPAGTYTLKYEFWDGTYTDIKNFIVGNKSAEIDVMKESEIYLNQRYSKTNGGFITQNGVFSLIIPFTNINNDTMILSFGNLKYTLLASNSTLYILDSNKSNPLTVNGDCDFNKMSSGVEVSNNGLSGTVTFVPPINEGYLAISLRIKDDGTEITATDFKNYVVTLTTVKEGGVN